MWDVKCPLALGAGSSALKKLNRYRFNFLRGNDFYRALRHRLKSRIARPKPGDSLFMQFIQNWFAGRPTFQTSRLR